MPYEIEIIKAIIRKHSMPFFSFYLQIFSTAFLITILPTNTPKFETRLHNFYNFPIKEHAILLHIYGIQFLLIY